MVLVEGFVVFGVGSAIGVVAFDLLLEDSVIAVV